VDLLIDIDITFTKFRFKNKMSFLADYEPALIHSPFDRDQFRQPSSTTGSLSSNESSLISFLLRYKNVLDNNNKKNYVGGSLIQELRNLLKQQKNTCVPIKETNNIMLSSYKEQVFYDRKYWTDKLVTFILMMPY
jgi:hypothetical protein